MSDFKNVHMCTLWHICTFYVRTFQHQGQNDLVINCCSQNSVKNELESTSFGAGGVDWDGRGQRHRV